MARNGFSSKKAEGQGKNFDMVAIVKPQHIMRLQTVKTRLGSILNTDEVGVLYRSILSRSIYQDETTYARIRDRLTAVLTMFSKARKVPLAIIGKSKRTKIFLCHFNGQRDLKIFHLHKTYA